MILVVTGSRTFHDKDVMFSLLAKAHRLNPIVGMILGDAKGADAIAKEFAVANGIPFRVFEANWKPKGKDGPLDRGAGHKRNHAMIDYSLYKQGALNDAHPEVRGDTKDKHAVYVVAFTDKPLHESKGTAGCVAYAVKRTTATIVHFAVRYGEVTRNVIQTH